MIDHSIIADFAGTSDALARNAELEFERNRERYTFLRWAQQAFQTLRVFPPDRGICHQVNLEYLSQVVFRDANGLAYPDTLVGTDSHTPMVNGLGILGWGVGGIEAEAAMLGQAISMLLPRVVGIKLVGALAAGRDRDRSRAHRRAAAARARRRRQARRVLRRRRRSHPRREPGDDRQHVARVRVDLHAVPDRRRDAALPARDRHATTTSSRWSRRTRRSRGSGTTPPPYRSTTRRSSSTSASVEPSLAGPGPAPGPCAALGREGRVRAGARRRAPGRGRDVAAAARAGEDSPAERRFDLADGAVVIAAITSCTNTSNPSVMVAAGLLARNAVERGLTRRAVGEDVARARLARGHRLLRQSRASPSRSARSGSTSSATAARRASATRGRSRPRSRRRSTTTTCRCARCSRATATSRAASTPTSA